MDRQGIRRLLALILALALLSLAGCTVEERPRAALPGEPFAGLEVTVLDAGKADAILLTTPASAVLIDCGEKGFGGEILDELAARGIERLDVLIVTHFDRDHVGGAAKLIGGVAIGRVLQSGLPKDSVEYRKYLRALGRAALTPETVSETLSFTLDGAEYTVDPPQRDSYGGAESNNSSLIVTVEYGASRLLFMGDAETARISEYLASSPARCDLLKLPHHGEKEKMLDALLAAVRPRYAVITCSEREPEAPSTARALAAAAVETYLTRLGAVRIRCDGETLTVDYR
ncbi:MAG: MBL fold metallo-hydrolase [Oscillospiraceae bacterium]|nr:MBL fold metallo-hydrolase [Oscillospiraceae bacterium]